MRFKEVDIKNRDFLADFSPNPNIVTYDFFCFNKELRPLSRAYGRPISKFPEKIVKKWR